MNDDLPDLKELERLGHVDPPPPAILDAAREVLWSAVATDMLATDPAAAYTAPPNAGTAHAGTAHAGTSDPDALHPDALHPGAPHAGAPNPGGEPAATRQAEQPAREPRRADPGAS